MIEIETSDASADEEAASEEAARQSDNCRKSRAKRGRDH